jgi:hypothetical protein
MDPGMAFDLLRHVRETAGADGTLIDRTIKSQCEQEFPSKLLLSLAKGGCVCAPVGLPERRDHAA